MTRSIAGGDNPSPPVPHDGCPPEARLLLASDVRFTATPNGGLVYRPSTRLVARVGINEWEVLRRFDGADMQQIRKKVERDCGLHIAMEELAGFSRHALAIGLLERPGSPDAQSSRRRRGLSWSLALWNPARVFGWCAPRARVLFHPIAIGAGFGLIAIAAVSSVASAETSVASRIPIWQLVFIFLVELNLVSILHECGHGIALHRYGASTREIGIRFVLGWPCWYCDITESYLLPRLRQRVAVLMAGPFVQAVVCAIVVLAARGTGPHIVAIRRAATLLGVLSLLNFFPFIRSDGYYLLTEFTDIPNLHTHAWLWLTSSAARHRMRLEWSRGKRFAIAAYGLASAAFMAYVLAQAVAVIGIDSVGTEHVPIRTVEAVLSVMVIVTTVARRRSLT
jgi:putative peptide zinc metalloprotease protein